MERLLALLGNAVQFAYTCGCNRKRSLGFRWLPLGNTRLGALALIRDRSRFHPTPAGIASS